MAVVTHTNGSISEQLRAVRDEAMSMRGEVAGIAADMQRLMQMEMQLAQAEVQEAKGHAIKGSTFGAVSGVMGLITSMFLFLAIMFAIDTALPLWAAALITTGIAFVLMAIFGLMAKQQMSKFSPMPRRAMHGMQENIKWAKSQIRSNGI